MAAARARAVHVSFNSKIFCRSLLKSDRHFFSGRCSICTAALNAGSIPLRMPSLSPTMTSGNVLRWLKKEGDSVESGDVLCEIETDKAVLGFEIEEQGTLAKIIKEENSIGVIVGELIGVMVEEGDDWRNFESPESTSPISSVAQDSASSNGLPKGSIAVKMPCLSPSMEMGVIVQWLKKEGDHICPGDALCEVQTDKAVVALETEESGILAKILKPEHSEKIRIGSLIALIAETEEDLKNVQAYVIPSEMSETGMNVPGSAVTDDVRRPCSGPAVHALISKYQLKSVNIPGSGTRGRLLKHDVLAYIKKHGLLPTNFSSASANQSVSKSPSIPTSVSNSVVSPLIVKSVSNSEFVDVALSESEVQSRTSFLQSKNAVPHAAVEISLCVDKVNKLCKGDITLNAFIVKCAAIALESVLPLASAIVEPNSIDLHVSVVEQVGSSRCGVVERANSRSLSSVASCVQGFRASDILDAGVFSVVDFSSCPVKQVTEILPSKHRGVLTVGEAVTFVSSNDTGMARNTKITFTLTYDASTILSSDAMRYLKEFGRLLEDPMELLLS